MNASDSYDIYSKYYDSIVDQRRDFGKIAQGLSHLMGDRKKILEIGVGTGLVVEKLIQIQTCQYEIWGIDNSPSLLEQARKKLEHLSQVHLYLSDVLDFELKQEFEAIYSRGGAFFLIKKDGQIFFASHLLSRVENLQALTQVKAHLQSQGLFLLSLVDFKQDEARQIESDITYRRQTAIQLENNQKSLTIELSFERGNKILGKQIIKLLLIDANDFQKMFAEAGLQMLEISADGQYYLYLSE